MGVDNPDGDREVQGARRSPVMLALSGLATFAFLAWLCWIITRLIDAGIPDADRAGLVETMILAATGVVISAVMAARAAGPSNPLGMLTTLMSAVRGMMRGRGGGFY